MKILITKVLAAVLTISAIIFIFNSCQKTNNTESVENLSPQQLKEKIIQATRQRYGNITAPFIVNVNRPASSVSYVNGNGQLVQIAGELSRIAATCGQYTCATAPSGSDLYVAYNLLYAEWYYECGGSGHDLTAVWSISTPYTVLAAHPITRAPSYGNVRIKNSGGTVLTTSSNLSVTITSQGTDPNCSFNTLYKVTYKWDNISDTYFPGNTVECALNLYNDCSKTSYVNVVGYTTTSPGPSSMMDPFTHPCDRVDKAFVNPPVSGGSTYATIAGAYVLCTPPSGFTGTDEHQIEYREIDSPSSEKWEDQSSTIYLGREPSTSNYPQVIDACCDVLNLENMTLNSAKWIVRYRNKYSNGCNTTYGIGATWYGNWHQEIWDLQ